MDAQPAQPYEAQETTPQLAPAFSSLGPAMPNGQPELPTPMGPGNPAGGAGSGTGGGAGGPDLGGGYFNGKPDKKSGPVRKIRLFGKWEVSRKKFFVILSLILVLLLGGGAAAYFFVLDKPAPKLPLVKKAAPAPPPPPPPIVSPLTGVVTTPDKRDHPVTGVMIENSGDARPQSGLREAGIVFEAVAEYGITRFLALYQESEPGNIGPVRSARPYYLDWAMAFDASYAHVGGSPDALARIKAIGVKDLDQFFNPSAYRRITQRYAPHNVYTTRGQLIDLAKAKGWATSQYTPLLRKAEKPYVKPPDPAPAPSGTTGTTSGTKKTETKKTETDTRTPAVAMDFSISGAFYNVHYDYDPATNSYKRLMGGAAHLDNETKQVLMPKSVVALVMPYSLMADGYHSQYQTEGTGKAFFFQDGTVTVGTWSKGVPRSQFEFKDEAGKPFALNAGQTWFSVVATEAKVTYR
jgi:hypothetical protein